jgi:hypothetical protein
MAPYDLKYTPSVKEEKSFKGWRLMYNAWCELFSGDPFLARFVVVAGVQLPWVT